MKRPMHIYFVKSFFSYPFTTSLGILLLFFPAFVFSNNCIRSVSYEVLIEESHQLPTGTDVAALPMLDILKGKGQSRRKTVELCVDDQNHLTITTIWAPDATNNTFYHNPVWKSVVNAEGTRLYDFDGQLIEETTDGLPFDPDDQHSWILTEEEIAALGILPALPVMGADEVQTFNDQGVQAFVDGEKFIIVKADEEIIYHHAYPYLLQKVYEADELVFSIAREYHVLDDIGVIPLRIIEKDYEPISKGIVLQHQTVSTYLRYLVVDHGTVLVDYVSPEAEVIQAKGQNPDQRTFGNYVPEKRIQLQLQLMPNPVSDQLTILLPEIARTAHSQLTLLDVSGKVLRQFSAAAAETQLHVDTSDLPQGIYLLQCQQNGIRYSQRFVKQ